MGGLVFTKPAPNGSPALHVPRMSTEVYNEVKEKISKILQQFYRVVATPHEAPGKEDHGDVDCLVEGPLRNVTPDDIAEALHAVRHVSTGGTRSYAVPHPYEDAYTQVDVHVCQSGRLEWDFFMNSYADLTQIIGVVHRPLGITSNDRGMHARVKEIEGSNRKASMLFLTDVPTMAMQFLGLDTEKYYEGFADEKEIFEWVANGRFFSRGIINRREEKANDRQRMTKRGMFRRFIHDWMGSHPAAGDLEITREEVLSLAIKTFGKEEEYNAKRYEHEVQEKESSLWELIKETLKSLPTPEPHILPLDGDRLSLVLRALKTWVHFVDGRPQIRASPELDPKARPTWVIERRGKTDEAHVRDPELLEWVKTHWETTKALEKKRQSDDKHERQAKKARLEQGIEVARVLR